MKGQSLVTEIRTSVFLILEVEMLYFVQLREIVREPESALDRWGNVVKHVLIILKEPDVVKQQSAALAKIS